MVEHPPNGYIDIDLNGQSRSSSANTSPEASWKTGDRGIRGVAPVAAASDAIAPSDSSSALPREELAPHVLGRKDSKSRGHASAEEYRADSPGSPSNLPLPVVRAPKGYPDEDSDKADLETLQIRRARCVSILSVAASIIVAILGLGIGIAEEALTLVGFGGEALLDSLSSGLVLWRFKRPKKRTYLDAEAELQSKLDRDERRERNSSIFIAVVFVFYAFVLLISSGCKWWYWDPETAEHSQEERAAALYGSLLAWPCAVIFGSLSVVKWRLARALSSKVLREDAICSILGAVLALVCAIAALVEEALEGDADGLEQIMMVDVSFTCLIAIILLFEGAHTLYKLVPHRSEEHKPLA